MPLNKLSMFIFVSNLSKMAIRITDECINCGACEPECPNNAIYEGGIEWALSDGTSLIIRYGMALS